MSKKYKAQNLDTFVCIMCYSHTLQAVPSNRHTCSIPRCMWYNSEPPLINTVSCKSVNLEHHF